MVSQWIFCNRISCIPLLLNTSSDFSNANGRRHFLLSAFHQLPFLLRKYSWQITKGISTVVLSSLPIIYKFSFCMYSTVLLKQIISTISFWGYGYVFTLGMMRIFAVYAHIWWGIPLSLSWKAKINRYGLREEVGRMSSRKIFNL